MADSALAGLRVLDLSDRIGGAYCTKLLADLGAAVILVEPPDGGNSGHRIRGGHPLRRLGPFPPGGPDPEKSGLFLYLAANKRHAVLDLEDMADRARLRALAAEADMVVETFPPGRLEALGLGYTTLREENPALVLTSLTDFGPYGPYRDWQGEEIVHWALGGYQYITGDPGRAPLLVPNHQAELHGGAHAALASLAALHWARRTGAGQQVDVSIFEAMLSAHIWTTTRWTHQGEVARRTGSELIRCRDGWLHFMTGGFRPELLLLVERPDLVEDPRFTDRQLYLSEGRPFLLELLAGWAAGRTREEVFQIAQELQLPMAPAYDAADLLASPLLAAREWLQSIEHPVAGRLTLPGFPYKLSETPPALRRPAPTLDEPTAGWDEAEGERGAWSVGRGVGARPHPDPLPEGEGTRNHPVSPSGPLAGLRILEVTNNWAGPVAGRYLADLGAEVIKIESPWRLASRNNHYAGRQTFRAHWNRTSYFNKLNRNKYGVVMDLATPEGRDIFLKLVAKADVVIENNSPRVMRQLKIDYPVLRAVNPGIIMLSISGFGQTGIGRNYVAFGASIEASMGLAALTGYPDEARPYTTNNYYADPIAGCHAPVALLAALAYRERTGKGQFIDLSLQEGGAAFFAESLLECALTGCPPPRRGNRHPVFAPQGCYPSMGDDMWVVLTVRDDDEWRRFTEVTGDARFRDARFATAAGRRAHHDELDRLIAEWSGRYDHHEAARLLQAAGLPAAPVLANWEMVTNLHAHARGFYILVPHREMGVFPYPGLPWKLSATPGGIRMAAPEFGEHNRFVAQELLGLPATAVDALYARRIFAKEPPPEFIPPPPPG